ncbi:MAG TPA: methyl-accepting chemotaxis protein [Pseudobdellovibrionaceae bacterium]|jgi:methyl-accepting chemotaxis protein
MTNKVFSLKVRLFLLTFALLAAQGVLIAVAITKSRSILGSLSKVTEVSLPATKFLLNADMYHDGIRSSVFEISSLDPHSQKDKILKAEEELKEKTQEIASNIKMLKAIHFPKSIKQDIEELDKNVSLYVEASFNLAESVANGKKENQEAFADQFHTEFSKLEKMFQELEVRIENDIKSTDGQGKDIVKSVVIYSLFGLFLSSIVGLVIFIWTKKSFDQLLRKIADVSEEVSHLSIVVGDESGKVKDSTVEQSAAIQESVSALSEMSSMIAQTGQNIKLSLETSQDALGKSTEGKQIMDRMSHSMASIQKANDQLQEISNVIEDIHRKTAIINDIVFKTQLLSFNASIEAARAGQHGRGFAVVAEEVGNLAELSGQAAKDIEILLGDSQRKVRETLEMIQGRVSDGNKVSQSAMQAFNEISKNIDEINSQVRSINEATQQQEIGIQQTNLAMKQMDIISQNNTVASTEALQIVQNLKSQSTDLREVMTALFELVGSRPVMKSSDHEKSSRQESHSFKDSSAAKTDQHMESLIHQITMKKSVSAPVKESQSISADDPDFKRAG